MRLRDIERNLWNLNWKKKKPRNYITTKQRKHSTIKSGMKKDGFFPRVIPLLLTYRNRTFLRPSLYNFSRVIIRKAPPPLLPFWMNVSFLFLWTKSWLQQKNLWVHFKPCIWFFCPTCSLPLYSYISVINSYTTESVLGSIEIFLVKISPIFFNLASGQFLRKWMSEHSHFYFILFCKNNTRMGSSPLVNIVLHLEPLELGLHSWHYSQHNCLLSSY